MKSSERAQLIRDFLVEVKQQGIGTLFNPQRGFCLQLFEYPDQRWLGVSILGKVTFLFFEANQAWEAGVKFEVEITKNLKSSPITVFCEIPLSEVEILITMFERYIRNLSAAEEEEKPDMVMQIRNLGKPKTT